MVGWGDILSWDDGWICSGNGGWREDLWWGDLGVVIGFMLGGEVDLC